MHVLKDKIFERLSHELLLTLTDFEQEAVIALRLSVQHASLAYG